MSDDEGAAAAPAAPIDAAADANRFINAQRRADLQRLPLFYGDDKDVFTAEQWIERVRRARTSVQPHWDDDVTMAAVYNALRGPTLAWWEAVQHELDNNHQWRDFQQHFINAWSKTRTARTTIAALDQLQQRMEEKVVNFFARVAKANNDINEVEPVVVEQAPIPNPLFEATFTGVAAFAALPNDIKMAQAQRLVAHGMKARNDKFAKHVFIAGLKEEIRNDLMKNPPVGGLYAAFVAAQTIEKALEKPKHKVSKTVKAVEEQAEVEVDAVNKGFRRPSYKKTSDKKNVTCYHCQKKGHFASDCYAKSRGEPAVPRKDNNNNGFANGKSKFFKKKNISAVNRDHPSYNPFSYLQEEREETDQDGTEEVATIHTLNF